EKTPCGVGVCGAGFRRRVGNLLPTRFHHLSGCLKNIFCRYIVFCRYGGQECPPYNPNLRFGGGLASPPYNDNCGVAVGCLPTLRRFCVFLVFC
ncbi:MAG: hypothetical protein IKX14_05930, partial [Neisseriaceae bacterium]|nr:hypothetical protein [Neisseriaceae bacterium]